MTTKEEAEKEVENLFELLDAYLKDAESVMLDDDERVAPGGKESGWSYLPPTQELDLLRHLEKARETMHELAAKVAPVGSIDWCW